MKILYVISTISGGVGGHYYSYKTIIEALSSVVDPVLLNVQYNNNSPVFDSIHGKKYRIEIGKVNLVRIAKEISFICESNEVDVVHVFDLVSLFYVNLASMYYKLPVLNTVCGGAIPSGYFPKMENITVFSREHLDYFSMHEGKYGINKLYYFPNRVANFDTNLSKIASLIKKHDLVFDNTILRITRISDYYKQSILQSVNLVRILNNGGGKYRLLVVGHIVDRDLYEKILTVGGGDVIVETSEEYYNNAKELIGVGAFNISTGRSAMESVSKGILTLVPSSNNSTPILLTENVFFDCLHMNFSERYQSSYTDKENIGNILDILDDEGSRKGLLDFYNVAAEDNFMVGAVIDSYRKIYNDIKGEKPILKRLDMIQLGLWVGSRILSHNTPINKKNVIALISKLGW